MLGGAQPENIMKRLLFGALAACLAATGAQADSICAAPQEIKVLEAAALQQQLMAAALSCHYTDEYNRFVTAFRTQLMQSDRALERFFARHRNTEGYNAFKTRIANEASLRSLKDPRFCESARMVFDSAFGAGGQARRGLVPEPPSLIDTGYEFCRALPPKPLMVAKTHPRAVAPTRPAVVVNTVPRALELAQAPKAAPVGRVEVAALDPVRPAARRGVAPKKIVPATPPVRVAALQPTPKAQPPIPIPSAKPQQAMEEETSDEEWSAEEEMPDVFADARQAPKTSFQERRSVEADERDERDSLQLSGRNIPNAYQPGARWVHDEPTVGYFPPPPSAVRYRAQPPWAHHRPRPRWVMGPDGRWYLVAPYRPYWANY